LKVFSLLDQEIRTLVNEEKQAGYFVAHWNGKDEQGREVPSGLYIYRIEAGEFDSVKKMLLLR